MTELKKFLPRSTTGVEVGANPQFPSEALRLSGSVGKFRCRFSYGEHPYPAAALGLTASSDQWTGRSLVDWIFLPGSEVDQTDFLLSGATYSALVIEAKGLPDLVRWSSASNRELFITTNAPPGWFATLELIATTPSNQLQSLASVVADLRRRVDLPIHDIARMCGGGRRQFYNLISGASRSSEDEARIRSVHSYVERLATMAGNDPHQVRAALLMPLAEFDHKSLFSAIVTWDSTEVRRRFDHLVRLLSDRDSHATSLARSARLSRDELLNASAGMRERRRSADAGVE